MDSILLWNRSHTCVLLLMSPVYRRLEADPAYVGLSGASEPNFERHGRFGKEHMIVSR
jgi:hypothetical protein